MHAKALIVALLLTAGGVASASDVSYDQARIRSGSATLVEGALARQHVKQRSGQGRCACSQASAPAPETRVARDPERAPSAS